MTALEEQYVALRGSGLSHHEAIDRLTHQLGVDRSTVVRRLKRAAKVAA